MRDGKNILVVDDNKANLVMARQALENDFDITLVSSGRQALTFLKKKTPDLILLDVNMPELDGIEVFNIIRSEPRWERIPVIFLTAESDMDTELECLEIGAVDFIAKPFVPQIMLQRIARTLELEEYRTNLEEKVEEKTEDMANMQSHVVASLADVIESRDTFTGMHVNRTTMYVRLIGRWMVEHGVYKDIVTREYASDMVKAAPMHDIGKISVPDSILCKPGKLTIGEFAVMKQHTTSGGEILDKVLGEIDEVGYIQIAKDMAIYHHERWDGRGYPEGRSGTDIPLCARVMAVADVFDAIISKRSYKDAIPIDEAFDIMDAATGSQFDPEVMSAFFGVRDEIEAAAIMGMRNVS